MSAEPVVPPGLCWLASYPKSGNTWLRILLSNVLSGALAPEDINNLSLKVEHAASRALFDQQTQLDSHLLRPDEVERMRAAVYESVARAWDVPLFMKTHDAWTYLPDGRPMLGTAARRAIYVVRDPRDVAVSFAYFQRRRISDLVVDLNSPRLILGDTDAQLAQRLLDWSGHVRSWLDQSTVPTLLIRYEDLLINTRGVLGRVLSFLETSFPPGTSPDVSLDAAVRHADFSQLQQQENARGFRERGPREETLTSGTRFFREGRSGGWRTQLTPQDADAIESTHGEIMARLNYLPTSPEWPPQATRPQP